MPCYLIHGTTATAYTQVPATLPDGALILRSAEDLAAAPLSTSALAALRNTLPDLPPVAGFKTRPLAVTRVWAALQTLEQIPIETPAEPAPTTKQARLIALLRRPEGATMAELMAATGWQRHSVRGALAGAIKRRLGLPVEATVTAAGRTYRIAEA